MASPQTENGFTRIANEILEQIVQFKFNGTQYKLLMVVWRFTYGFNRPQHEFSNSFFAEATGANLKTIKKELGRLIEDQIITEVAAATFTSGRILAFNKDWEQWKTERTIDHQGANWGGGGQLTTTPPNDHQWNDSPPGEGVNTPPGEGANRPPKKESIKKSIKEIDNHNIGQATAWEFYYQNFGVASPFVIDDMNHYIDNMGEELVIEALKRALKENKAKWSYAEGILKAWSKRNVKSLADVEGLDSEFRSQQEQRQQKQQQRSGYNKQPIRKEMLPDWFETLQQEEQTKKQEQDPEELAARKAALEEKLKMFRR